MSKPELVGMVILIVLISYNFKLSLSVKRLRNQIGKKSSMNYTKLKVSN
ncbi:MAG: hypothetical protein ABF549_02520 [Liquorilactobacillus nagelii]